MIFFPPSSFLNYSVYFLDLFCFLLHYTSGLADQVTSASLPFRIMHLYWSDSEALVTTLRRVWGAHFLVRRFVLGTLFFAKGSFGERPKLRIGLALRVTDYALWWNLIHESHIVRNIVAFGWEMHLCWSQWWLFHQVNSIYHALFILDLSSF